MRHLLYHGTDARAARFIAAEGLRPSFSGFGQTHLVGCALQESREEAARYRGDRSQPPVVLTFEVELVDARTFEIANLAGWAHYRAEHARQLCDASRIAMSDDHWYWTSFLRRCGFDAAVLPSTLIKGGGREYVIFDSQRCHLVGGVQ